MELQLNGEAIGGLLGHMNDAGIEAAHRISDSANAASSHGFYDVWEGNYTSRVYGHHASKDTDRGRRLLILLNEEAL